MQKEWLRTPEIRNNVQLDEYIVMPNHFHGIIIFDCDLHKNTLINDGGGRGVLQYAPTTNNHQLKSPSQNLGAIIRGFKNKVTTSICIMLGSPGVPVWQRNYYEQHHPQPR